MTSQSQSNDQKTLQVIAPEETTEIFIVGDRFQRIASGVGTLNVQVSPGFYKIRFRSGMAQRDQFVDVTSEQDTVVIQGEEILFNSTAPISQTQTSRKNHQDNAVIESKHVHLKKGVGSQLFIFVRDLESNHEIDPWEGITIHDGNGQLIAELDDGIRQKSERFAAINIELDPGTYSLRVNTDDFGVYEMFVVTSEGWQTQLFGITTNFYFGKKTIRRIELKSASMFMSYIGQGFNPYSKYLRLTEIAKIALESGRNIISNEDFRIMLRDKFENPILGIFSLHLLLKSKNELNYDLVETVINNLTNLIGPHPDIQAVQLETNLSYPLNESHFTFPYPPTLRNSWDIISRKSIQKEHLVPSGSIFDHVADGLLDTTPWLLHRVQKEKSRFDKSVDITQVRKIITDLLELSNTDKGTTIINNFKNNKIKFNPLEHKIINATFNVTPFEKNANIYNDKKLSRSEESVYKIMQNINAPTASIARSTDSIIKKLEQF